MAIWQLTANYSGVSARGRINGFPVITTDASGEAGATSAPLNAFLIGKGNVLKVEVLDRKPDAEFSAKVEHVQQGDMVETGGEGQVTLDQLEYTFDSDEDHFSGLLAAAQPVDAKVMVDFALKLRDYFNGRKHKELVTLLSPKMAALADVFGVPIEAVEEQVDEVIDALCRAKHKFEAADVNPVGCCGNKLWQLMDTQGEPLIRIKNDEGGLSLDIVAAKVPEGIRIVR
jgi:hypothetical protein